MTIIQQNEGFSAKIQVPCVSVLMSRAIPTYLMRVTITLHDQFPSRRTTTGAEYRGLSPRKIPMVRLNDSQKTRQPQVIEEIPARRRCAGESNMYIRPACVVTQKLRPLLLPLRSRLKPDAISAIKGGTTSDRRISRKLIETTNPT